ncbi:MAG TPA: adenylosuccinate synthase [Chloroflexota bacterium]|nr:adenylosuccinate synthase [Chloroflexota bacterium]
MPVIAVVGGHWGDEGKGKLVDFLAERAKLVVRANGGRNAGHTVVVGDHEFNFHLVPSGMLYPGTTCVIGPGVVMDPIKLVEELDELTARGIDTHNLLISDRTHLVLPYHLEMDRLNEEALGAKKHGTTGNGIAPSYTDKWARIGLRAVDLLDPDRFSQKYRDAVGQKNRQLRAYYGVSTVPVEPGLEQLLAAGERLRPYIGDSNAAIQRSLARDELIVLEGGQATLLDIDHGTYPFISSSSVSAGLCLGAGIPPNKVSQIYGVFKAFCSRVGNGPFPTELEGELADHIRGRGKEYGVTTGRPRRIGWFDAVAGRYAVEVNGVDHIFLTKPDVLDDQPVVKVCTAYELDGKRITTFPTDVEVLERCKPVYEELPGFGPMAGVRKFEDLPPNAQKYVQRLEELLGAPATMVGTGQARDDTIVREDASARKLIAV